MLDWAVVPWAGSVSSPQAENGWHERGESKMGTFSKKVEPLQTPWVSYRHDDFSQLSTSTSPPFHTFLHAILARTSWGRSSALGQGTLETGQQNDLRSREIS